MADSHANNHRDVQQGTSLGSWSHEVWRRRKIVAIVLATTVLVALGASTLSPKTYKASADVKVSTGNTSGVVQSAAEVSTVLATQVQVLLSTELAKDVEQRLGETVDIVDVAVEGIPESQIATVTVTARTADGAAKAANTYAIAYDERRDRGVMQEATRRMEIVQRQVDELTKQLEDLQKQIDEEAARVNLEQAESTVAPNTATLSALQARYADTVSQLSQLRAQLREYQVAAELGDGGVAIVSTASVPSKPTTPGLLHTGLLAGLLGLGLGVGLALMAALRDRRLHDRTALRQALPYARILGTVRATKAPASPPVLLHGVVLPSPRSAIVDTYREVAIGALQRYENKAGMRLMIAGATHEDSDRSSAGALAVALSGIGKCVALIDARSSVSGSDEASHSEKASETIAAERLPQSISSVDMPGGGSLHILSRENVGELQHGIQTLGPLVRSLTDADVVIVHSDPLLSNATPLAVVTDVDAVLLTVTLGVSTAPAVAEALDKIAAVRGELLGVVLDERKPKARSRSGDAVVIQSPSPLADVEEQWIQPPPAVAARRVDTSSRS